MGSAFVTGCGSGFGLELTRGLLARGHRVVATDRVLDGWERGLGPPDRLLALALDVRDDAQVEAAVAQALRWPIDLLVNNAGVGLFGTQEEMPVDRVRDLFDVNVFGPIRVTRALLPTLRANRGTVVQLASVAGRTVFPESGFYAASKHALEALSEALLQEVAPFGVRVRVIEPGAFATRFQEHAAALSPAPSASSPYAAARVRWNEGRAAVLEPPQDPRLVADAILATLDDPAPYRRVPVGPDAERILALRDALGPHAWTRLAADRNGLSAPHGPGEVPSPEELLALPPDHVGWALARLADRHGHLDHYALTDAGRRALARLRA
jgi:NAD(P)-dependent dehydrogenase (short-subunit alcohol dehydrogenase family)